MYSTSLIRRELTVYQTLPNKLLIHTVLHSVVVHLFFMEYLTALKIFSWKRIELSLLYINQVWLMKQSQHASIAQGEKPPEHKMEQQMPSKFC